MKYGICKHYQANVLVGVRGLENQILKPIENFVDRERFKIIGNVEKLINLLLFD